VSRLNTSVPVRVPVKVWIEGVGEYEAELIKFLAPATVTELVRLLPIEGMAGLWDYAVYIETRIARGAEKPAEEVNYGDIIFWPPAGALGFVFKKAKPYAQTVKVGKLSGDLTALARTRPGARVRVLKV